MWKCLCECGNYNTIVQSSLIGLLTKSCGCLRKKSDFNKIDLIKKTIVNHGVCSRNKRLYSCWSNMIYRCYNPNDKRYKHYGSRGISVCLDWRADPSSFEKWALTAGYNETLTLDRIDNNGNYSPENCRWITKKEQNRNKRTTILITYKGETLCIADMALKYNKNRETLRRRIFQGWSPESAIETPPLRHSRKSNMVTP